MSTRGIECFIVLFIVTANYCIPENEKAKTRNAYFTFSFSGISPFSDLVNRQSEPAMRVCFVEYLIVGSLILQT